MHSFIVLTQLFRAGFFVFFLLLPFRSAQAQQVSTSYIGQQDSIEVASITFHGNEQFSQSALLNIITTKTSPASFWTFVYKHVLEAFGSEPRYFDSEIFQQDVEIVKQFYYNNGYFKAAVHSDAVIDSSSGSVALSFTIDEGIPSYIERIEYRNLDVLSEALKEFIYKDAAMSHGQRYRAEDVQKDIARILTLLENNGYPDARSDSVHVERRLSSNNVSVVLPFYFGKKRFFGDISIQMDSTSAGKVKIAHKLIEERLEFRKGDVFSKAKREQGEMNLNKLRVFSLARVNTLLPSIRDTLRSDIPVVVLLQPRNNFEVGVGPLINNQESRFNIGIASNLTWLNIFGAAQIFSASVQYQGNPSLRSNFFWMRLESYQATFGLKFEQPYFLDNATGASAAINYVSAREKDRYNADVLQLLFSFRRQFAMRLGGALEVAFEQSEFTQIDTTLPGDIYQKFGSTSAINYFNDIITATLDYDLTDDFFNPTAGSHHKFIIEEAGRISTGPLRSLKSSFEKAQYHKIEALSLWYGDVSNVSTAILGFKLRVGGIFRYGKTKDDDVPVPFTRSYYVGGSNSVRGWSSKQLAVDSTKIDFGSNALMESSLEVRWLPFKRKAPTFFFDLQPLGIVLFADAGNLWNEFSQIRISEMALAFGLGIRYNTPFGPIRIDYGLRGYNPSYSDHQWITQRKFFSETVSEGALHFGIAHAF